MANVEKFILNQNNTEYNVSDIEARNDIRSLKTDKMDAFTVSSPLLLAKNNLTIDLTTITRDIEDIKNKNTNQIPTINNEISAIKVSVTSNTTDISETKEKVNTNTENITSNTTDISKLKTDVNQNSDDITTINTTLTTAKTDISELKEKTETNKNGIDTNVSKITALENKSEELNILIEANKSNIAELQNITNTNTNGINSSKEEITTIKSNIKNLQDNNYLKTADIQDNVIDSNFPPSSNAVVSFVKTNINSTCPTGSIILFSSKNIPEGNWIVCDGRNLVIDNYQALYSVIGKTYGGNETEFNLPNLTPPNENMVYIIKN